MASDDFTFPGTDLAEYHEYRTRRMQESSPVREIDLSPIIWQLETLQADVTSIKGIHP
jgi:hypothetical protein